MGAATSSGPPEVLTSCLIASSPRTGSWLLAKALEATGVAGRPLECFQPFAFESANEGRERDLTVHEYVADCVGRSTTDNGVFGTVLKLNGVRWLVAQEQVRTRDFTSSATTLLATMFPAPRWIHLHRLDHQRQAVSWYRSIESGVWHTTTRNGGSPDLPARFRPDYQKIRWLEDLARDHDRRWRELFTANQIDPLDLTYEELDDDLAGATRRVVEYLGLEPPETFTSYEPLLTRQADTRTTRWLARYSALRDTFEPSPWQRSTATAQAKTGRRATSQSASAPAGIGRATK